MPFDEWLEVVFPLAKFPASSLYLEPGEHLGEYLNTDKDTGCVMDDPARTMANPMLDFDAEAASEKVVNSALSNVVGRGKPVFAIARGSGGGKSRTLEEIRRNLLRRDSDKVLPVAITFNHNSDIGGDMWWQGVKYDVDQAYALSLTARVASATLGVAYDDVYTLILKNMRLLDISSESSVRMIRQMVTFFVGRVNQGRMALGRSPAVALVDTFVFLLDENRKVDAFADVDDMGRFVRAALLNSKLPGINVAVVVSDLGFLPETLRTSTDRKVVLLVPPPRLSPELVLETWWKPKEGATAEQTALLLTLIALYNNMPRALEFAAGFLHLPKNMERVVDRKLVSDLTAHMLIEAYERYSPQFPPTLILKSAFFRTLLPVDESLLGAFQTSVVTNPIVERSKDAMIVPDVSLLLLQVACNKASKIDGPDAIRHLAHIIGQGIDNVLGVMLAPAPSMGVALEVALTEVLRIRLALAIQNGTETLTLQRLCGLTNLDVHGKATNEALLSPLPLPLQLSDGVLASNCAVLKLKAKANDNLGGAGAFLAELDAIDVGAEHPVRILRSAPDDSWDVCVKAYNPATRRPFHVFFDCKSGSEFEPERNNTKIKEDLRARNQYAVTSTALALSSSDGSPPRDFVFVYCVTHEDIPDGMLPLEEGEGGAVQGGAATEQGRLPRNCAVMGRDSTIKLLGPFAEMYRVARSSLSRFLTSAGRPGKP